MKIRSMTATFGKLDHARLELGDGLNLIYAPNEGGKSTWAAFWKAMLYGIDTRDRDKKGYLADKNRYQPWSGAPMEGTMDLEWQDRDITLRRGPKGSAPFGAFSAVYTGTEEAVPGLTAANCGELLTGVGREVFERSAFIGSGGDLAVTAAPELERRIAALVSSGEEDVSYSQTEGRLREWLNRRKVNRSVGLIPRLEGELREVDQALEQLEELSGRVALLEGERTALSARRDLLAAERATHRRLAQRELDRRFAQAREELEAARSQLATLEGETAKYGPLPDKDLLKKAQGELQYLKVLDEELRQGEAARKEAEEVYVQAQIAAQDDRFPGMTWEEGGPGHPEGPVRLQHRSGHRAGQGDGIQAVPCSGPAVCPDCRCGRRGPGGTTAVLSPLRRGLHLSAHLDGGVCQPHRPTGLGGPVRQAAGAVPGAVPPGAGGTGPGLPAAVPGGGRGGPPGSDHPGNVERPAGPPGQQPDGPVGLCPHFLPPI